MNTTENFRESLRLSLDWLATEGHIQWGDADWGARYNSFFAALASWEDDKGTLESGFNAAFTGVPDAAQLNAVATFRLAYYGASAKPTKPKTKKNPTSAVKKAVQALRA